MTNPEIENTEIENEQVDNSNPVARDLIAQLDETVATLAAELLGGPTDV